MRRFLCRLSPLDASATDFPSPTKTVMATFAATAALGYAVRSFGWEVPAKELLVDRVKEDDRDGWQSYVVSVNESKARFAEVQVKAVR